MDWKRVETLLDADVDRVVSKSSNAGAALTALIDKIRAETHTVELVQAGLRDRLDALPPEIRDKRSLSAKCDAIIAKADGDGRADLAAAARAKKDAAEAAAAALESELAAAEADVVRADDAIARLGQKADEIEARVSELGLVDTLPALEAVEAAPAAPKAAPAAASGGDDLDAEFAALMAGMDLDDGADARPPSRPVDDEPDLALPDLVEVADGELPEGADPDADGEIDFSALDALAAKEAGLPAPKGKKNLPAVKGKNLPAVKDDEKHLPAVKPAAKPPAKAGEAEKPSRKRLWIAIGGVAVAIGGTLAALFGTGVL